MDKNIPKGAAMQVFGGQRCKVTVDSRKKIDEMILEILSGNSGVDSRVALEELRRVYNE